MTEKKLIRELLAAIQAQSQLLACYRLNRHPSEALFRRLEAGKLTKTRAEEYLA